MEQETNLGLGSVMQVRYPLVGGPYCFEVTVRLLFTIDYLPIIAFACHFKESHQHLISLQYLSFKGIQTINPLNILND